MGELLAYPPEVVIECGIGLLYYFYSVVSLVA